MSWYPADLPRLVTQLAEAIEKRFAKVVPERPREDFMRLTASDLPPAAEWEGCTIYVRNVDGAGASCLVFSDRTNWRRCDTRGIV